MTCAMNAGEINAFLEKEFPQIHINGKVFEVTEVKPESVTIHFTPGEAHLRPGGTVSGPSMFTLADLAAYAAILARLGPVALAVTTNLNINFMRKPSPGNMRGVCRILKLGKRLCVLNVDIYSDASSALVAHATGTYSIPPH
ncbi:PaaI family thioesterase [Granulosicoccaceae sp. 1_MG-2023]|nr:PaaI family thioesterase [Granulosicoccaceae sp. 1_MG-2023]